MNRHQTFNKTEKHCYQNKVFLQNQSHKLKYKFNLEQSRSILKYRWILQWQNKATRIQENAGTPGWGAAGSKRSSCLSFRSAGGKGKMLHFKCNELLSKRFLVAKINFQNFPLNDCKISFN